VLSPLNGAILVAVNRVTSDGQLTSGPEAFDDVGSRVTEIPDETFYGLMHRLGGRIGWIRWDDPDSYPVTNMSSDEVGPTRSAASWIHTGESIACTRSRGDQEGLSQSGSLCSWR
jgi:hypothetical protein